MDHGNERQWNVSGFGAMLLELTGERNLKWFFHRNVSPFTSIGAVPKEVFAIETSRAGTVPAPRDFQI